MADEPESHAAAPFTNPGVYQRIELRLDRIEDKLDKRLDTLDGKVDAIATRQTLLEGRLDGVVGMVRWLGPAGIAALLAGLLVASGLFPRL